MLGLGSFLPRFQTWGARYLVATATFCILMLGHHISKTKHFHMKLYFKKHFKIVYSVHSYYFNY